MKMTGIWERYGSLLPKKPTTPMLSLGEGNTPLVACKRLGAQLGFHLWAKCEGCNPTGSFKDRGMVVAVAKAIEEGARSLICASTGNTSASAAAFAAAAGIPCFVLLPAGKVALGKLAQAVMYGARVLAVRGNFDQALELARQASRDLGIALMNSVNPYRLWGQRSGAWEIVDTLGSAPDWLAIPVGNAGNISAYWAGFVHYRRLKGTGIPRMMGFQAAGAAPLATGLPCPSPETVATAIRIGNPVNARRAHWAVRQSRGAFWAVTDEEILEAQALLASEEGIFAEPASCAPLAGLRRLASQGETPSKGHVVMILTGNGLKDTSSVLDQVAPLREIDASWNALRQEFAS